MVLSRTEFPRSKVLDLLARRDIHDLVVCAGVGSTAHGIGVGSDDLDYTVIRLESWTEFVNGPGDRQSMMIRTQPEGERSGAGDIDLNVYTLRKFAHLAASGNPSILNVLWTPEAYLERALWPRLKDGLKDYVRARSAGDAYLGYCRQQMERWQGTRGQKNVTRPELVEQYGFDTKYAAHIIRLAHQGIGFMLRGEIEIPIQEPTATEIRSLRTGGYTESQALNWAVASELRLKDAIKKSILPEYPNRVGVAHLISSLYGTHFAPSLR